MNDTEIRILDRFSTPAGLMFTVRDDRPYRIGQTVRYRGVCYTVTEINTNSSLNLVGLRVVKKP